MNENNTGHKAADLWSGGYFQQELDRIARAGQEADFGLYGEGAAAARELYETVAMAAFTKRCKMSGWEMAEPDSASRQLVEFLSAEEPAPGRELAYAVHFMDWQGANRIEEEVAEAAVHHLQDVRFCLTPAERDSRVKVVRYDEAFSRRLVVVPRKRLFAFNSRAEIIKRSVLVIDLSDSRQNHFRQQRSIINMIRLIGLTQEALAEETDPIRLQKGQRQHDGYLDILAKQLDGLLVSNPGARPSWLQPVVTSFYARRPVKRPLPTLPRTVF